MCKVMAITDVSRIRNFKNLLQVINKHITLKDNDGFGWAAQGVDGVFGERTIDKHYKYRLDRLKLSVKIPIVQKRYNTIGVKSDLVGGAIFHGRTSTNQATLLNTHPIVKNGWTLIHNGVVTNKGPDYKMETTNDTEHLVHYLSTTGIRSVEEHLTGYYAFCALDPLGQMHIARDGLATLYCAYVQNIDAHIFATTEDLIENVCKDLKWKVGPTEKVLDNYYMIFKNNELFHVEKIKPRGYDSRESSLMSTSLHYLNEHADIYDMTSRGNETDINYDRSNVPSDETLDHYIHEIKNIDSSYHVYSIIGDEISVDEFKKLDDISQMECTIFRADGTLVDPDNYFKERLA